MSGIDAPMAPAIAKEAVKKVKPNIIFGFQFSVTSNQLRRVSASSVFLLLVTRNGLLFRVPLVSSRGKKPVRDLLALVLLSHCNQYLLAVVRAYRYQENR